MNENEPIRHSISFPPELYDDLKKIAKRQYRPLNSVVLEACDFYVSGRVHEEAIRYLKSEEGRNLIRQIMGEERKEK